jgi:hypothetical protein
LQEPTGIYLLPRYADAMLQEPPEEKHLFACLPPLSRQKLTGLAR